MQKAPRANRSKKTLPAAFVSRAPRMDMMGARSEPTGLGGASSSTFAGGEVASKSESGNAPLPPPQPPPMLNGWAAASGADMRREAIPLDALVFLSGFPQKHGHFALKKMLHPPTLGLFCLVELPGAEHQRDILRASLQDWLARWCGLQRAAHNELLVDVCEAYWDAPQGYPMGILCEYMPLGSLDELVQACGGLPEEALREMAQAVLQALHILHSASPPLVHGCVKASQVLFSASGLAKLTFGLEQRVKRCQVWSLPQSAAGPRPNADGSTGAGGSLKAGVDQPAAQDIVDLGVMLLVSALGGMDVLLDAIHHAREYGASAGMQAASREGGVSPDTCALLQHELRGAFRVDDGEGGQDGGSPEAPHLPPAHDLLFNRSYSAPFLSFVSTCIEALRQGVSAGDLLQHEFLCEQPSVGPLVSLREMQALARLMNEAPEHDPNHFGPGKKSLSLVPGVAPSVAQSSQIYLMNIAQSIAPHCGPSGILPPAGGWRSNFGGDAEASSAGHRWREREVDTLLADTARTLGLSRSVVQEALQAQIERLLRNSCNDARHCN